MKPLINNPSIIVEELNKDNDSILLQADEELMSDETVIRYLMSSCPKYAHKIYAFSPIEIKNDVEILKLAFVRICQCETFNVLPKEIQNNKHWMLKAVEFNPYMFNFLSLELQQDLDFNIECSKVVGNFSKSNIFSHILNNEKFIWEVATNSTRDIFYSSILNKIENSELKNIFTPLYENSNNENFSLLARKEKLSAMLVGDKTAQKQIKI